MAFYVPTTMLKGNLTFDPYIWIDETNPEAIQWLRLRVAFDLPATPKAIAAAREAGEKPQGEAQFYSIGCPIDPALEYQVKQANDLIARFSKGDEVVAHGQLRYKQTTDEKGVTRDRVSLKADLWQVFAGRPRRVKTEEVVEDAQVEA